MAMRQYLLSLILLTTITLSSSNVLPILSINKVDSDTLLDDQEGDNTLNNKQSRINPNIFYKVFIGTSKDNLSKKSQLSRLKYLDNDNNPERNTYNGLIANEDNFDDEGFRKEQWHNYPRQLDRLHKNSFIYKELEKILNANDLEQTQHKNNVGDDVYQYTSDDILGDFDSDAIAGPLLILKIRLAYLTNNWNNHDSNRYIYTDSEPMDLSKESNDITREKYEMLDNDDKSILKVKRKGRLNKSDIDIIDGTTLVESMAILQYLEDTRPEPSLQPSTPLERARMREICETIVSGIQPLQNLGLKSHFEKEDQYLKFTKYWSERGLESLEALLRKSAGRFCVKDQLTMADLCLVPQLYNAVTRHKLSLDKFPTVSKLYETLLKEKTFRESHPENIKHKVN